MIASSTFLKLFEFQVSFVFLVKIEKGFGRNGKVDVNFSKD